VPALDAEERELHERVLIAAGHRRVEPVDPFLFPPDQHDAS
jgi:hypothetical protein